MKQELKRIWKKYKIGFITQIVFIMINVYLLTFLPKIIGKIIDYMYDIPNNIDQITNLILTLLGLTIILLIVRVTWKFFDTFLPRSLEMEIKNSLFSQLLKLKLHEIQNKKNGELMSYFVKDIREIRMVVARVFSHGSRIIFFSIFAIYSMIINVDLKLTIFTIVPIIITSFIIIKIKEYIVKSYKKAQESFTELSEYIQESTDAIRTVKAYSQEKQQLKKFIKINQKLRENNNSVDIHSALLTTTINICFGLCYAIALIYGSKLVILNQITIGNFVAFNGYIGLFYGPVSWLPSVISRYKRAQVSYNRLDKVFKMEKEKINTNTFENGMIKVNKLEGNIEIKDLNYHYPNSLPIVLENFNITLKKGETLGIIGKIGAGKTTLVNLLSGLYNVEKGKIFIDGKDINNIPIEELRENICYITQDSFLFSTKLKDNISLFKDDYDDNEIETSTKKAVIYDEIYNMPNNIETVIGERGIDLSGGQKQRISISRAFLKQSSIVIFDDTFSALDNKTEETLIKNIIELTKDKSCIIISNRISDIKHSNKIIVLENGKIVEKGTHEELINKGKKYYEYYKQQATQNIDSILS